MNAIGAAGRPNGCHGGEIVHLRLTSAEEKGCDSQENGYGFFVMSRPLRAIREQDRYAFR